MLDLIIIGVIDIHTVLRTSLKTGVVNPVSEITERFSGSALAVALNASLLEVRVGIISPVGRDAVGLLDLLKRYSVDYSHLVLSSKKNTNVMEVLTPTRHYNLYYQGALGDLQPEKIERGYLKKAKVVHICFPDHKVADHLVKAARKENILTSVDAAFCNVDADIVFTEKTKKEESSKEPKRKTVVMDFQKRIKVNGKKIPVFRESTFYQEGVKDAFIAAFLARYLKSEHTEHAALYGSCAAALCSQTQKRILSCTKEELDTFFAEKLEKP
jgi:sugar/nucleoside kinase (ribokinase family)